MKKHRLITVLAAALVGVSAAAFPPAAPEAAGSIVAEAASGDTFNYGNFEFTHGPGSNEATLTNYLGSSTTPSIPSQVYDWNGRLLTVKKIGEYAFIPMINGTRTPRNITAITIPSVVTEIGNNAFSRTPLVNITIPSSVGTIGTRAFSECTSLEYVRIEGSARIGANAFLNCTALHHVILDPDCFPVINPSGNFVTVFQNCTSLQMINDTYAYSKISVNGAQKPVLSQDDATRNLIRRFFLSGTYHVGFVDSYCTDLCKYIVDTETKSWMSDAVKARQLHDWIVRHCNYEDELDEHFLQNESRLDTENMTYFSVFLSYGLNIRDQEIGEAVCQGISYAYTMLLSQANIKSYVLFASAGSNSSSAEAHAWNLVKIASKWYQVDVTWDDKYASNNTVNAVPFYGGFMKSDADMNAFHSSSFRAPEVKKLHSNKNGFDEHADHPLVRKYYNYDQAVSALASCSTSSMTDGNGDGILDGDFNFNGTVNQTDTAILNKIGSGDLNLDGRVNSTDTALIQYFANAYGQWVPTNDPWVAFCYSLDHWNWLDFCIKKNIL